MDMQQKMAFFRQRVAYRIQAEKDRARRRFDVNNLFGWTYDDWNRQSCVEYRKAAQMQQTHVRQKRKQPRDPRSDSSRAGRSTTKNHHISHHRRTKAKHPVPPDTITLHARDTGHWNTKRWQSRCATANTNVAQVVVLSSPSLSHNETSCRESLKERRLKADPPQVKRAKLAQPQTKGDRSSVLVPREAHRHDQPTQDHPFRGDIPRHDLEDSEPLPLECSTPPRRVPASPAAESVACSPTQEPQAEQQQQPEEKQDETSESSLHSTCSDDNEKTIAKDTVHGDEDDALAKGCEEDAALVKNDPAATASDKHQKKQATIQPVANDACSEQLSTNDKDSNNDDDDGQSIQATTKLLRRPPHPQDENDNASDKENHDNRHHHVIRPSVTRPGHHHNFAGQRKRKASRNAEDSAMVELDVPHAQYWAVVEGLVALPETMTTTTTTAPLVHLEQLLGDNHQGLLPRVGRVQELLPFECHPGRWTAKVTSAACLDFLRHDWTEHRLTLRHQDHPLSENGCHTPAGFTRTKLRPACNRIESTLAQGIVLASSGVHMVSSLSLVAFAGFESADESRKSAHQVAHQTLQAFSSHLSWPSPVLSRLRFPASAEIFPSADSHVNVSSGVGALGCFVDDIDRPDLDYHIILTQQDSSKLIVGLEVIFTNSRQRTLQTSPSTYSSVLSIGSGASNKRRRIARLTRQNLELHGEQLESEPEETDLDNVAAVKVPCPPSGKTSKRALTTPKKKKSHQGLKGVFRDSTNLAGPYSPQPSSTAEEEGVIRPSPSSSSQTRKPSNSQRRVAFQDIPTYPVYKRSDSSSPEGNGSFHRKSQTFESTRQTGTTTTSALTTTSHQGGTAISTRTARRGVFGGNHRKRQMEIPKEKKNQSKSPLSILKKTTTTTIALSTPQETGPRPWGSGLLPRLINTGESEANVDEAPSRPFAFLKQICLPFQTPTSAPAEVQSFAEENADKRSLTRRLFSQETAPDIRNKAEILSETVSDWYTVCAARVMHILHIAEEHLPPVHDVFYGVYDDTEIEEITQEEMAQFDFDAIPQFVLDEWLLLLGEFCFPPCEPTPWPVLLHDVFHGVHDEVAYWNEAAPREPYVPLWCHDQHWIVQWLTNLWDDERDELEDTAVLVPVVNEWLIAMMMLPSLFNLLWKILQTLLVFDVDHGADVGEGATGYWTGLACSILPSLCTN